MSKIGTKTAISDRLYGEDCEAYLAGALQSCLHPRHSAFDVTRYVFQYDNCIVDDQPGRDCQGHQRQIVESVAKKIHHPEGADQRDRDGDSWDQGCAQVAEKQKDHEYDKTDRYDQGPLDIMQRSSDCFRPVHRQVNIDGSRDRSFELWQDGFNARERLDDVGARLPVENHQNRRLAIRKAEIAQIFD